MADERKPNALPPPKRHQFTIGIICALGLEAGSVEDMFDGTWYTGQVLPRETRPDDENTYTLGRVGNSYVALVWMCKGYGSEQASLAAKDLKHSFPNITYVLVVGVCGGAPMTKHYKEEILLGDVIISTVLHKYDKGKQYDRTYVVGSKCEVGDGIKGFLHKTANSKRARGQLEERCAEYHRSFLNKDAIYPGWREDRLYKTEHPHKHYPGNPVCEVCINGICESAKEKTCEELGCGNKNDMLVSRERLRKMQKTETSPDKVDTSPAIHFGPVGSANTVMKSGTHRDAISDHEKIIAFEMEGAGVWEVFKSVVVIKGVCDYSDSHKQKKWQRYAATTATACARAFMEMKLKEEGSFKERIHDWKVHHQSKHLKAENPHSFGGAGGRRHSITRLFSGDDNEQQNGFQSRNGSQIMVSQGTSGSSQLSLPDRNKNLPPNPPVQHNPQIPVHGSVDNEWYLKDSKDVPPSECDSHGHEDPPPQYSLYGDSKHQQNQPSYFQLQHHSYGPPHSYYGQQAPYHGYPTPGSPHPQDYLPHGFPPQGYPSHGYPQGYPPQGYPPNQYPVPHHSYPAPYQGQYPPYGNAGYLPPTHPMNHTGPTGIATPPTSPFSPPAAPKTQPGQPSQELPGPTTQPAPKSITECAVLPTDTSKMPPAAAINTPTIVVDSEHIKSRKSISLPIEEAEPEALANQPVRRRTEPVQTDVTPPVPSGPKKPAPEPIKPPAEPVLPAVESIKPAFEPAKPAAEPAAKQVKPAVELIQPMEEPAVPIQTPHEVDTVPKYMEAQPEPNPELAISKPEEPKEDPIQTQRLLQACGDRQLDIITNLLSSSFVNINGTDPKGKTALQLALGTSKANTSESKMANIASIVSVLCKHGADVESRDSNSCTPLHLCAKTLNSDAAIVLLNWGADINAVDKKGQTPLYLLALETGARKDMAVKLIDRGAGLAGKKLPALAGRPTKEQTGIRKEIVSRKIV